MKRIFSVLVLIFCSLFFRYGTAKSEILKKNSFITNIKKLRRGLHLPIKDSLEEIKISYSKIKSRVMRFRSDSRVEPVKIRVREKSLMLLSERLARRGHTIYLYQEIKKSLPSNIIPKEIIVTPEILRYIDRQKLTKMFSAHHHRLVAFPQKLDNKEKSSLLQELKYFFPARELKKIKKKIIKSPSLIVDKDLLPEFAAKMVRRYTIFRGPNCFHAVLAFQDPAFPKSVFMNVKKELGYHRAMINHDELWRALQENFYEVQPHTSKLNFGDIIVFFKIPEDNTEMFPSYRWLKHTAVYLFNNYTFSKGSKSSNSPYTVKTLGEEWKVWKRILQNPAIKVFRRDSHKLNKKFTANLKDWLY